MRRDRHKPLQLWELALPYLLLVTGFGVVFQVLRQRGMLEAPDWLVLGMVYVPLCIVCLTFPIALYADARRDEGDGR